MYVGHEHLDFFEVVKSSRQGEFGGIVLVNPSLTTNAFLYPSYRIYLLDPKSYALVDYEQYRFNLEEANEKDIPSWRLSYKFKDYYNVSDLNDYTFQAIAESVKVKINALLL